MSTAYCLKASGRKLVKRFAAPATAAAASAASAAALLFWWVRIEPGFGQVCSSKPRRLL